MRSADGIVAIRVNDTAGRLEDVCEGGSWLRHFTYDSNSNRTLVRSCSFLADSCRTTCSSPVDLAATYDDQDRILTHGAATYAHNRNGDLTTKTVGNDATSFVYDAYGNLKQVILPDLRKIEYVVDGRNRRVARREYAWDGQGQAYVLTDERRWLWQGQLRIVAELDGDGELVKRFVYGTKVNVPEYMVAYDPVSHLETGTYRILTDQLGSLRLVVDASSGTVVQRMQHDEWGNVLEDVGSGFTPFGFAGGLYDPATGLVRFGARDYDPETGRWTAKDPIGFDGGYALLYSYCGQDVINSKDPSGLDSERDKDLADFVERARNAKRKYDELPVKPKVIIPGVNDDPPPIPDTRSDFGPQSPEGPGDGPGQRPYVPIPGVDGPTGCIPVEPGPMRRKECWKPAKPCPEQPARFPFRSPPGGHLPPM